MKTLQTILTPEQAEKAIESSGLSPVFIYKHSPICEISEMAAEEVDAFLADSTGDFQAYKVDVLAARAASQKIELISEIRHESPQALLFIHGRCVWNASHRRIKKSSLALAIKELPKA